MEDEGHNEVQKPVPNPEWEALWSGTRCEGSCLSVAATTATPPLLVSSMCCESISLAHGPGDLADSSLPQVCEMQPLPLVEELEEGGRVSVV